MLSFAVLLFYSVLKPDIPSWFRRVSLCYPVILQCSQTIVILIILIQSLCYPVILQCSQTSNFKQSQFSVLISVKTSQKNILLTNIPKNFRYQSIFQRITLAVAKSANRLVNYHYNTATPICQVSNCYTSKIFISL